MAAENLELTDTVVRLKEGFEDKDVAKIAREFDPKANLNFDGRFSTVREMEANLKRFFESIDQAYLDVVGIEEASADRKRPFVCYNIDLAWVDKKDWMERSQKIRLGLTMQESKEGRRYLITGLTATTLKPQDLPGDKPQFPDDVGETPTGTTARGSDIFSIWY